MSLFRKKSKKVEIGPIALMAMEMMKEKTLFISKHEKKKVF